MWLGLGMVMLLRLVCCVGLSRLWLYLVCWWLVCVMCCLILCSWLCVRC